MFSCFFRQNLTQHWLCQPATEGCIQMDRRNSTPCEVQFRELRLDGKPRLKKRLRKKKEPVEAAGPEIPLAPPSRAPKAVIDPTNLAAAQNLFFENPTVNPVFT